MNKSFTFHESWRNILSGLPAQVRLEVFDAIMEYGLSGILTELKATARLAFSILKNDIDMDNHRAESIRKKRSEAGKKHRGNQYSKQNGTNGTSVPTEWNKCSKHPLDKGVLDDCEIGTNVPLSNFEENKEDFPLTTLIEEKKENTNTHTRAREKFIKPTLEDVMSYIEEKGYDIDPVVFWNFYEANGWVQGQKHKPIKNWKACVTTWTRNKQYSHNNGTTTTTQNAYQGSGSSSDSELQQQSVRIIERLKAERLANS